MKNILLISLLLIITSIKAQTSLNMNLIYQWQDTTLVPSTIHDNTYNEVWGYAKNGREYAIIGSTAGTHIFDITDINNVDTIAMIPGKVQGGDIIHRDYDTYQDYLYIVADEGASSLQIVDLSLLPTSAPLVYDEDTLIIRSHNIFIDTVSGYLYTCGGATNMGFNKLSLYDLSADPLNPQFLMNCEFDIPQWNSTVGGVHDIYVRNDTAFCNAGQDGLHVFDFSNLPSAPLLGSLTTYIDKGYNHSGWLHESGNYYALADENHGMRVKLLDVSDLSNINLIDTVGSNVNDSLSIPHNLIFKGDNLYVSYYFDGLYVFNTSNINNITLAGYYDTSTRPIQDDVYEGNWGVYPFLPSGKVLASDMQEGLFVFETSFTSSIEETAATNEFNFVAFPNPANNYITVITTFFNDVLKYSIIDVSGKLIKTSNLIKSQTTISLDDVAPGIYAFSITRNTGEVVTKKFIKK